MTVNKKILILAVIIVLVAAISVLAVQKADRDHASNVTTWMQQHAGQEVTAGEYLEIMNPGYLESRPREVREAYSRMNVRVPDLNNSGECMQYGERSAAIAIFGYREVLDDKQPVSPENSTGQCIMNESMFAVSNALAGREISAGKYFKTVCPAFFSGMTESQKAALNNQSLTVSKITDRDNISVLSSVRIGKNDPSGLI